MPQYGRSDVLEEAELKENSGPDGITEDDVVTVVQSDQKQRFSLRWRIPGGTGPNDDYEEVQLFSRGSNVTSLMETGANRGKNTRSQMPRCDSANPGNGDVSAKTIVVAVVNYGRLRVRAVFYA
ncbi:RNA 2'-phosphotransferase, Tpt1/KptA family protein [Besnoitia besnoiti]|uniref:RNA 2'-phosphotransferase, Tpt1/KptA family protein n=1 Tax=Besnoitia besnoiti TaxID=94643 RepID=A0A2A9MQX5_BESBE|nr:RNA 2'-phosphotransferase, Tpt1/KptA family protein [Besnoitia besnoiti]PFH38552.1 RNA 2'-phosphotransferase, Tpt1/KptA family protein [Besnoitia besnoiti]